MRVFRLELEDPSGWTGPYQASLTEPPAVGLQRDLLVDHTDYERWPCPWLEDVDMGALPRRVCGCVSLQVLKEWFGGYLERFREVGARVAAYDVPEDAVLWADDRQVVYVQAASSLVVVL